MDDLIFKLCSAVGVSGNEKEAAKAAIKEFSKYADVTQDKNGNVFASIGDKSSKKHIMIDAHIDQIGMVVTALCGEGFLRVAPCGGVDIRVLPGSVVEVHGRKIIYGIVCSTPLHLRSSKADKIKTFGDILIDTGLDAKTLSETVFAGDYVSIQGTQKKLLNNKLSAPSMDNRSGVATLIRCAELVSGDKLGCRVTFVLSVQEETGALGAKTASYLLEPDEAIVVDVSFAEQPGVPSHKCGKLGGGPMIGISPLLSRKIKDSLINLSKENGIKYQIEVMGGSTGTNADSVSISKSGVPCGLLSIPQRNMHTSVEVVDGRDIESTANLLALYIRTGGAFYA